MRLLVFIVCALVSITADADMPLSAPERVTVCSRSGTFCGVSDPAEQLTRVGPRESEGQPWTIKGWHRWFFVSDDGECAVVGYGGMNLVPRSVSLEEKVLAFYCR